jgi:hypothetical protein
MAETNAFIWFLERREHIVEIILIALCLGFLISLLGELMSHYLITGHLPVFPLVLSILSIVGLISLSIFLFIPQCLTRRFSARIFYNAETGEVKFIPLIIAPPYKPAVEAEIACRELFETSSEEKEALKEGKIDSQIFEDLAEVLAVSWLSQTNKLHTTPLGETIREPILLLGSPIKRIEGDEILRKFAGNMFFKLRCPSIIPFGVEIPKNFEIVVERREGIKGLVISTAVGGVPLHTRHLGGMGQMRSLKLTSKGHFAPIAYIAISFWIESIMNAVVTMLHMFGYTPRIIGAEEIICNGKVIKGDELKELQKWREVHYNILIEVGFRRLISLFHPRFGSYYRWVRGLFEDAKHHFDFSTYMENLKRVR